MLLILDNKVSNTDRLSYTNNVIRALKKYNIPYIRVDKVINTINSVFKYIVVEEQKETLLKELGLTDKGCSKNE